MESNNKLKELHESNMFSIRVPFDLYLTQLAERYELVHKERLPIEDFDKTVSILEKNKYI